MLKMFKRKEKEPSTNHYHHYEEGKWKADLYKYDADRRYTIIDFKFNDSERYIKYYYK